MHDKIHFRVENNPSKRATAACWKVFGLSTVSTDDDPSKYEILYCFVSFRSKYVSRLTNISTQAQTISTVIVALETTLLISHRLLYFLNHLDRHLLLDQYHSVKNKIGSTRQLAPKIDRQNRFCTRVQLALHRTKNSIFCYIWVQSNRTEYRVNRIEPNIESIESNRI
jgi:hypothetical protein